MNRDEALLDLPISLATALRLRDAGIEDELIATALGIEPNAVQNLLEVAEAKLRRLLELPLT